MLQQLVVPDTVRSTLFEDSAIVLDTLHGVYYAMNDTAALCWKTILAGGSIDASIDAICSQYATTPETAKGDVETLLDELLSVGLVQMLENDHGGR